MAPHLRTLSLSHFRSHKRAALSFDGRPVACLPGRTEPARPICLKPSRSFRQVADCAVPHPRTWIRLPEALGWRFRQHSTDTKQPHEVETGAAPDAARFVRIDGKAAPQAALGVPSRCCG
jgi:DNA replication and repair protein RecF